MRIQVHTSSQTKGLEQGVAWRKTLTPQFIDFFTDFEKKLTVSFRHANKTHFHNKVLKVSLLFCVRVFGIASQPEEFPWTGLQPVTKGDTGLATSQSQEYAVSCNCLGLLWSDLFTPLGIVLKAPAAIGITYTFCIAHMVVISRFLNILTFL